MRLPSVYDDWSNADVAAEKCRILDATAVEREWMHDSGIKTYDSIDEVLTDHSNGVLVTVTEGTGYSTIDRLRLWTPERDDPEHPFHYSPNFILPGSLAVVESIIESTDVFSEVRLAMTSLVRHRIYQSRMSKRRAKMAVPDELGRSSHEAGMSIDIDGCGGYVWDDSKWAKVNPSLENYEKYQPIIRARLDLLEEALLTAQSSGFLNFVPENKGTREECLHICVKPD